MISTRQNPSWAQTVAWRAAAAVSLFLSISSWAASGDYPLDEFTGDKGDLPSLQRGAQTFFNYCLGCHGLRYQRYQRTADDLGIPADLFAENLIFTGAGMGSHIESSMDQELSKNWFGVAPPDLTMVTRVRGVDWLYTYLRTFYVDETRPLGVNNKVFPNVGMPHALIELQGVPELSCKEVPKIAPNGGEMRDPLIPGKKITETRCDFITVREGTGLLDAEAYEQLVLDLVNFLDYVSDPTAMERQRLGVFVLLFLVILFVLAYLLNREYWQNIR